MVTSSTVKSGSYSITFSSAFTNTPSFLIGADKMTGPPCDVVEWSMKATALSKNGFTASYTVGTSTTINSQSMYYLGINPSFSALGTYCGASFTNFADSNGFQ